MSMMSPPHFPVYIKQILESYEFQSWLRRFAFGRTIERPCRTRAEISLVIDHEPALAL
jgi:hypothetical protein